ncbi:hypothetical protein B296_00012467 [Ensete ventricosum]|uniref:Uncharacterized protein n=1 Tax=Ensete ventricosum TaxID=4639 RepID=A0A426ZDU3_ENSVE|nr:hypothetical protein B296_00012467 [Ensete ventricosum]
MGQLQGALILGNEAYFPLFPVTYIVRLSQASASPDKRRPCSHPSLTTRYREMYQRAINMNEPLKGVRVLPDQPSASLHQPLRYKSQSLKLEEGIGPRNFYYSYSTTNFTIRGVNRELPRR